MGEYKNSGHRQYEVGVIHGRFQILHNDHLSYLMDGKQLCRHLVVGITNPDPSLMRRENADLSRSNALSNPLTYYERYLLLRTVLEEFLEHSEFSIVPLPVNLPELYHYYVPMDAVFFLSIYDDWGRQKLGYFRSLNLRTHILREVAPEEKGISSSEIRELMLMGKTWEHLVPAPAVSLLKRWDIPARLRDILKDS
jgi:nicotinamide mononucleotide adenylyltransferase